MAPWRNEASASDVHGDFIAFIQHVGAESSELYAKTPNSATVLDVTKGSSTLEIFPALHTNGSTRNLVWQASTLHEELGSWSHEIVYHGTVTSTATPVSWGAGQRPAISQNIAAWENGSGGSNYTLNRGATFRTLPASSHTERLPAVGGNAPNPSALIEMTKESNPCRFCFRKVVVFARPPSARSPVRSMGTLANRTRPA